MISKDLSLHFLHYHLFLSCYAMVQLCITLQSLLLTSSPPFFRRVLLVRFAIRHLIDAVSSPKLKHISRPHALRVFTLITWSTRNLGLWVAFAAFVFCSFFDFYKHRKLWTVCCSMYRMCTEDLANLKVWRGDIPQSILLDPICISTHKRMHQVYKLETRLADANTLEIS